MKCVVCKQGETLLGKATVTLDRDNLTLVVKGAPAQVCSNCGEEYLDEEIVAELLGTAEEEARAGTQVDVREYRAA
ncbi:MAG: type II toxin-antitoxin system MqsA family antitoxin [Armatimonadota bacterium]|nr:type II toxin-antitoxin system MqsA family antitoxin [Armatimonadota bacterium]